MKYINKATKKGIKTVQKVYESKDLDGLRKSELQTICEENGVPVSGTKAEIIERIINNGQD